jgi:uncharacterized membrane protein YfhO
VDVREAEVFRVFEYLVGVTVPPRVASLRLTYRPNYRVVSTLVSLAGILAAVLMCVCAR